MINLIIRTRIEGFHSYEEAPFEVNFLSNPHRHLFYVTLKIEVFTAERQFEFFLLQRELDTVCVSVFKENCSCEEYAINILNYFKQKYGYSRSYSVSVYEDNENGAEVIFKGEE